MENIVYVLVNEAMPGYVKIGKTNNLEQRIRSLDTTGVPLPFECFYACAVKDADFVERQILDAFMDHRVRSSREFFEIAPERAVAILKLVEIKNVTPGSDFVESREDQQAINRAKERRAVFNFKMVDIPAGAELSFSRDENIKSKVIDSRNVEFGGEIMSLSAAADKALRQIGIIWKSVQGPAYWIYDGELLDERRRRYEEAEE
ncbi:MAG TPA: GIY-YIG nuclease family protein [Candidatus Pacearchaeota archaeon]|nr:GIY-YIG nuclease family protein [Candidatus Pacearchaeota archaeon]